MSAPAVAPASSSLTVRVFDGTRQPFPEGKSILYTIIDGMQRKWVEKEVKTPTLVANGLPFYDNYGDNYSVIVYADGYKQAGFFPVKLSPASPTIADIMLIPKDPQFNFANALWDKIKAQFPLIARGVDDVSGRQRYSDLMEDRPLALASLLNLCTAMSAIFLPQGTPLDYMKRIIWDDTLAQDRFFAWCDPKLIEQVRIATAHGEFAPEPAPWLFHPGSTSSWKQIQFGEANVQLTFHENDIQTIDGLGCVKVEPDIDYYKDLGAHAIFEVVPNAITHGLSNPAEVYVLRWIAGRRAGIPEFNPPYVIV